MDDKKKKTFDSPKAEVVGFANEDIITLSTNETAGWTEDGYTEEWR